MYAIIDIETTGGKPEKDRITEIAIIIHDGNEVVERFSSLVNPECYIPYYISKLTGITDEMVREAPKFHEIAKQIVLMTENCVFVAHNVQFDYGFVRASFKNLGFDYNRKTLCTVKLSRKAFLGLPSYSLGKLCDSLGIPNNARHRALGDAEATSIVFDKILKSNPDLLLKTNLKTETSKTAIPLDLDEKIIHNIPDFVTGVYYFHNKLGEIIYVGKSINIKKRILQHFTISNQGNRRSLALKYEISDITFENTGSELIALLLESDEIKKHRPKYNISQKKIKAIPYYGIYSKTDAEGYDNLYIERWNEEKEAIHTADNSTKAKEYMHYLVEKYNLCLSKCDLHNTGGACFNHQINKCQGACCQKELPESYNQRVQKAYQNLSFSNKSFFLITQGRTNDEKSVVCVENGQYKGFGYIETEFHQSIFELRNCIKKYYHNRDIQLILQKKITHKVLKINYRPEQLELF